MIIFQQKVIKYQYKLDKSENILIKADLGNLFKLKMKDAELWNVIKSDENVLSFFPILQNTDWKIKYFLKVIKNW